MMKDMIDKRNERERIARSIIKYWNVNYIPRTQADSGMQKQTAEAENAQDQTMDPNMQEDYNKATNAYSGKYGQEKDLDEVTKDQIDKMVREAAKILDLEPLLDRKPKALSGGQRQRVAMGRAIVRNPKVFLMDEPLSNLDAKLRVQMRIEIQKIHQRLETTIIYVTHDQTEAMTLGTRIVVLKDGIIQQVDTPQNLYDKPCNVFVAGFMGSPQMNLINAKVVQSGEDVVLMFGGNTVKLPEGKAQKLIEAGYVDTTVIMGIRPEDLNDSEVIINANPDCVIEATIRVYELLGAEVYLYFDIDEVNCTARVNPRTTARPGDTIKLGIDMTKLHIFDKDTEQVILH